MSRKRRTLLNPAGKSAPVRPRKKTLLEPNKEDLGSAPALPPEDNEDSKVPAEPDEVEAGGGIWRFEMEDVSPQPAPSPAAPVRDMGFSSQLPDAVDDPIPGFFDWDGEDGMTEPPTEEVPSVVFDEFSPDYRVPVNVPEAPPMTGILNGATPAPIQRQRRGRSDRPSSGWEETSPSPAGWQAVDEPAYDNNESVDPQDVAFDSLFDQQAIQEVSQGLNHSRLLMIMVAGVVGGMLVGLTIGIWLYYGHLFSEAASTIQDTQSLEAPRGLHVGSIGGKSVPVAKEAVSVPVAPESQTKTPKTRNRRNQKSDSSAPNAMEPELELSAPPTGQLGGDTVRSARSPILSPERARVPAQTRTGGLSVRSQGGSRQLEVYVDGTSYGHSPVDLQLSPGVHSVWLVPVGSENQKKTYDVEIVVGEVKTLSF